MNSLRPIEERLNSLKMQDIIARPPSGWIRFIRKALNMSSKALAKRVGVSPNNISETEKAEAAEAITLSKLKRVAEGLNCEFVYYFLPREPIDKMLEKRARYVAELVLRNDKLRNINIDDKDELTREIEKLASELILNKRLWDVE